MDNFNDLFSNIAFGKTGGQLSKEDYAARKKEERDDIFALADAAAVQVASDGGKFKEYLDIQCKFDRYSAVNALLIMAQKPEAEKVADFGHWKGIGSTIKPGQTGISILEPQEYTKKNGERGVGYKVKKVFDISQVDTRKIVRITPPKYEERQILKALIAKAPVKINGVDELPDGCRAVTDPETGEISVRKNMGFSDTFTSIAQELGCYEADRDSGKMPTNPSFTGYCTAYILCKKYGAETKGFDFAAVPSVFKGLDTQGVKQELSIIRDAADTISLRMVKQLDSPDKTARNKETRVRDEVR